ncbi:MAG: hypothetical protein LH702_13510 [Phormidesmis sp. CAN_BIN44]|nr:hypothetical protein [Phormidesmis sp. CAN_BIN44]
MDRISDAFRLRSTLKASTPSGLSAAETHAHRLTLIESVYLLLTYSPS